MFHPPTHLLASDAISLWANQQQICQSVLRCNCSDPQWQIMLLWTSQNLSFSWKSNQRVENKTNECLNLSGGWMNAWMKDTKVLSQILCFCFLFFSRWQPWIGRVLFLYFLSLRTRELQPHRWVSVVGVKWRDRERRKVRRGEEKSEAKKDSEHVGVQHSLAWVSTFPSFLQLLPVTCLSWKVTVRKLRTRKQKEN